MKSLARQLIKLMPQLTVKRSIDQALENVRANLPYIHHTILDLPTLSETNHGSSAIIIGAGPSLHRKKSVSQILNSGYAGELIAADGALGHCLRNGLVPHYVVTIDPHPTRIVRWFGDHELESRIHEDDYFRRQDLDPYMNHDQLAKNRELIHLVDRYGPRIKAIISTSAPPNVTQRCLQSGMELHWWNPIVDDVEAHGSLTRRIHRLNNTPCMVSGGNVGTAAWIFAHQILNKQEIALVGMDMSYAPETPVTKTQYYKELKELFGKQCSEAFISVHNPYLKQIWYADPALFWYRESFLQMVKQTDCKTYNCTEGGILFGKGIELIGLKDFLTRAQRTTDGSHHG